MNAKEGRPPGSLQRMVRPLSVTLIQAPSESALAFLVRQLRALESALDRTTASVRVVFPGAVAELVRAVRRNRKRGAR